MHSRLSSLLLIGLLFTSIPLFSPIVPSAYSTTIDRVLGQNFYFHRELSGIDGYRILNTTFPTYSDNKSIIQTVPIGVWEVGDGWISPEVPRNITLERSYNFLFSVWGAGSGNATLFFRFYAYRNGTEYFLFSSDSSDLLASYPLRMVWQHKTNEVNLEIEEGDRLVLRLFINVTIAGTFGLGYDCIQYPSYVNDPTETRYMRSDSWTVNTLTRRKFTTSQTTSSRTAYKTQRGSLICYWGIRVYKVNSIGTKTELTAGVPAGIVQMDVGEFGKTEKGTTWSCPNTSMVSTDAILVEVWGKLGVGTWSLLVDDYDADCAFISEQLGADTLNGTTWYPFYSIERQKPALYTDLYYYFGSSSSNSRIANIVWHEAPITKTWQTVTTWAFQLPTRQWQTTATWNLQLVTKAWQTVGTWTFQILTKQWNIIGTWLFSLDVKGWHMIAMWLFTLESTPEINIIPILFLFTVLGALLVIAKKRRDWEDQG